MSSSGPPQQVSLVKYGKPEHVHGDRFLNRIAQDQQCQASAGCGSVTDPALLEIMQHACKEAALSQIDKDQILDAIVPPREWEEDGKHYRQLISREPAFRGDVLELNALLNEQLTLRQARPDGICPIRRELSDQCFDELIRQVTLTQPERGLLLLRVRDELRMTMTAYQNLFVSARDHDPRVTVGLEMIETNKDVTHKNNQLAHVFTEMDNEYQDLSRFYDNSEQMYREERESKLKRHHEEFNFLKRVNNTLKQQIDAMNDPGHDLDPVIEAYETVPSIQSRLGIWKYTKICKTEPEPSATHDIHLIL